MSKPMYYYWCFLDATSGGRVYQARWMHRLGIPPIPQWAVMWFINFKDRSR
jgi:hypothetical protein